MAKFTRQAIMYSTLKLLQIKPIDKITVRDICDQCELTRNTFYLQELQRAVHDRLPGEFRHSVTPLPRRILHIPCGKAAFISLL